MSTVSDARLMSTTPLASGEHLPPLAAAFGGGGPFGIGYCLGVAEALMQAGVPLRGADLIGTSAGSWVAALVATGLPFRRLHDVRQLRVPDPSSGALQAIATDILGESRSAQVTACAVRLPLGRRVLLSGAEHRLADIVAASSAVPVLFRPVRVAGSTYVDGGVRSLVSADQAAPARHLLVVAPIAGPMFGPGGRTMELMLRAELLRWQRRTGGKAHLVRPNAAIAALARHPLQLFDIGRAHEAYLLAHAQARALLTERPALAELVAARGNVA